MTEKPHINFTGRDYETSLQSIKDLVASRNPENWNSFFEGDLGTMIAEMIAYNHDVLSYTLDAQTQEMFIDTLRLRESLLHFSKLTGYQIRRNTPATVEVYAQCAQPPATGEHFLIEKGVKLTTTEGISFEVIKDYRIEEGNVTPIETPLAYGDVQASIFDSNGNPKEISALVKIVTGTNKAIISDLQGNRLTSGLNFGHQIGQGHILILGKTIITDTENFGPPPDISRDEFAIVDVSKEPFDVHDRSVLLLDRPYDGATDFIGQWKIENRNIVLRQAETRRESTSSPVDLPDRKSWEFRSTYYPVISDSSEPLVVSGIRGLGRGEQQTNGVTVLVNGVLWSETPALLFEPPDARVYEVEFDEKDQMIIRFGDGIFGSLIPPNASIEVLYTTGGGSKGNIPQNTMDASIALNSGSGRSSTVWISNRYTVGRGGQDRETITEAKKNIVQFVRTNDRAVTQDDYSYLASNFVDSQAGRVKLAKGVLHSNAVPREQNIVYIYTWVEGTNGQLSPPTFNLKSRLLSYMNDRKMICDEVVILDGITTSIPLRLHYRFSPRVEQDVIKERVASALNSVFKAQLPGQELYISKLYEAVESIPEIEYVLFDSPASNVIPQNAMELFVNTLQEPASTTLAANLTKGQFSLVVEDPTIFSVKGRVSVFQLDRKPTSALIESISGSVITLRSETPLQDDYKATESQVINSDYLPLGWQFERKVNIYVKYSNSTGGVSNVITDRITTAITGYFRKVLKPEQTLNRSKLESIVSKINGVSAYSVTLNTVDSPIEQLSPSSREKIVLGNFNINGVNV
jgi:uncharacterized phage protein gp47/JayE